MFGVRKEVLDRLRKEYPIGSRVELVYMNDAYRDLEAGLQGTVTDVDDVGTIHVNWDNGSCLGVAYGEDKCRKIK